MPVTIDKRTGKPEFWCEGCGQEAGYLLRRLGAPITDTKVFCGWASASTGPVCRETGRGAGGPRVEPTLARLAPRPAPLPKQMDLF